MSVLLAALAQALLPNLARDGVASVSSIVSRQQQVLCTKKEYESK